MKTGDIVFYTNRHAKDWKTKIFGFLNTIIDGKYTHCEIIYLVRDEKKCITLSADYKINFKTVDISDKTVIAVDYPVSDQELQKIIFKYQQKKILSGNIQYSYKGLLNASIASILKKFGVTDKKTQLIKEEPKSYCSELIIEIMKLAGKKIELNDNIASPNDLFQFLREENKCS